MVSRRLIVKAVILTVILTVPAHPTSGCVVLAPESSLLAKSHRPGRVQLRPGQLTEAQPSLGSSCSFLMLATSWTSLLSCGRRRRFGEAVDDVVDATRCWRRCRRRDRAPDDNVVEEKHRVLLPKSVSSSRGFLVPSSCQVSCTQRS